MPKFTCDICKDSFDTDDDLTKHLNDHAEADRADRLKAQQHAPRQPKVEPGIESKTASTSSSKKAAADAISSFAESVLANDDDDEQRTFLLFVVSAVSRNLVACSL